MTYKPIPSAPQNFAYAFLNRINNSDGDSTTCFGLSHGKNWCQCAESTRRYLPGKCPDQLGITVQMCVERVSESAWNPPRDTGGQPTFYERGCLLQSSVLLLTVP